MCTINLVDTWPLLAWANLAPGGTRLQTITVPGFDPEERCLKWVNSAHLKTEQLFAVQESQSICPASFAAEFCKAISSACPCDAILQVGSNNVM
jgi:hypothetical protein